MPKKRTLLIDGDVVAYKASTAVEQAVEWAPGYWTWNADFEETCTAVRYALDDIREQLEADKIITCLSDPEANFRLDILPTYKTHRKTVKKPLVLLHVKEWMQEVYGAKVVPSLEGDDVMGILATRPNKSMEERIVVSIDKDLKTIPGLYVRTKAEVDEAGAEVVGGFEVQEITEDEADYNHLYQTLTGDTADGYKGCPGIGPAKVGGVIEMGATIPDNWAAVVKAFEKAKLGEEEALRQACVARILRYPEYDFKRKEPIPWKP